ncbi:MAG: FAD-binding oxidoreductase [Bdellovibrionota bacterium]
MESMYSKQQSLISGWGRCGFSSAMVHKPTQTSDLQNAMVARPTITRGLGRSYGDSALQDHVLSLESFQGVSAIDPINQTVVVDGGVTLDRLLRVIVPQGYFVPVVPGTKFITMGGAIASDIHGKNHHQYGSFSQCVKKLDIYHAGEVVSCNMQANKELFWATVGGMGLTGPVIKIKLQLRKIVSSKIDQKVYRARNIDVLFDLFEQYAPATYTVAWLDCLQSGKHLGRGVFIAGEHAEHNRDLQVHRNSFIACPSLPFSLVRYRSIQIFNQLFYVKNWKKMKHSIVSYDNFFFPLDGVRNWNRLYGRNGFMQYQVVLPKSNGKEGMVALLEKIHALKLASFLSVLKYFGPGNQASLSFPMEGWTLALDFPFDEQLVAKLQALDRVTVQYGGRVYLTKDNCLDRTMFDQMYPQAETFRKYRRDHGLDMHYASLQSERLAL